MSSFSGDRGVLLALLALERGYVSRDDLLAALHDWAEAPGRSLVDVLIGRGMLRSEQRTELESSLEQRLREQFAEQATTPPTSATHGPSPTPPLPGMPMPAGLVPQGALPSTEPDESIRYRKTRMHNRGGLGAVFVAKDTELDREVALKEILEKHADNPMARERFELEARITGRLEHPGIVPVYGLGVYRDGRPYYAMRFIHGHTLQDEINRYHEETKKGAGSDRTLALRGLLTRFQAVCDAIGYAHARGVVHRDIKPANIMLGGFGETLVVDWGLAKLVNEDEAAGSEVPAALSGGRDRLYRTRMGAIAGTPFYMSPEQAAGRTAEVGPASDIYSLGATLYYLLTGSLPYEQTVGEHDASLQPGMGPIVPPRKIKADVPAALEAVCLKAMARLPEERYASAGELREEIDRWLADEPPLAYRESLSERVIRFARKHRSGTMATAAVLVGITVVSLVAMVQIRAARQRESVAYRVNLLQRDFSHGLERFHWDRLGQVDATLAEWEKLQGRLEVEQDRLHETMARWIRGRLDLPSLSPEELEQIGKQVEELRERDPKRAGELDDELRQRLRRWDRVFWLQSPFLDAPEVLGLTQIRQEDNFLVPQGTRTTPLFTSRVPSPGNVRLRGVFEGWEQASVVGLLLDQDEKQRYQFIVCVQHYQPRDHERDLKRLRGTLGQQLQSGESVSVRILRNTDELARLNLRVPSGPLILRAERIGSRLTVQVNQLAPLVFDDPFPLVSRRPGVFGLVWPDGVRLRELEGQRQSLSPRGLPAEQGDLLMAQGEFEKALGLYEEALRRTMPIEGKQEVQFKRAVCLLELDRTGEAGQALEELVGQLGRVAEAEKNTWLIRAACNLWLLRLKGMERAKADGVLARLAGLYSFVELTGLVPARLRREILDELGLRGPIWRAGYQVKDDIEKLREAVRVEDLLNEDDEERRQTRWRLMAAYRANGQMLNAVRLGESLLDEVQKQSTLEESIAVCRDFLWTLLEAKQAARSLETVDAWLKRGPEYRLLLVDRARILVALGRAKEGQAELERFFGEVKRESLHYAEYADACLLRGYLRLDAGDRAGAEEAWRAGQMRNWPGGLPRPPVERMKLIRTVINRTNAVTFAIQLGALLKDLREDEAMDAFDNLLSGTGLTLTTVRNLVRQKLDRKYIRDIMVDTYTSARGSAITRKMVYRQLGFRDFFIQPGYLSFYSACRVGAFPASGPTAEEEKLIWQGVQDIVRHFEEEKLNDTNMRRILQIWLGEVDPLQEWKDLDADLDAGMRLALALQFGYRYHQIGRDTVARTFLQEVVDKAPRESAYYRLARDRLEEWKAKKP